MRVHQPMSQISMDNRAVKFTFFLLGITLPIAGMLVWAAKSKSDDKQHADEAQLVAVEDSFPASDPPASW